MPTTTPTMTATFPFITATGSDVTHHHSLAITKQEYAFQLDALPFSHPRQLIDALPILRQWAILSTLLKSAFPPAATQLPQTPQPSDPLTPPTTPPSDANNVAVQISLNTTPLPTLAVTYPCPARDPVADDRLVTKIVQVGAQGKLSVSDREGDGSGEEKYTEEDGMVEVPGDVAMQGVEEAGPQSGDGELDVKEQERKEKKRRAMAQALEKCADLGIWVEWLRGRGW